MKSSKDVALMVLAGSLALAMPAAHADAAPAAPPSIAGWDGFVNGLRDLPAQMLAKLPEAQRRDPQVQQEVGRLILEALATRAMETISADPSHPAFLPSLNPTLNIYQPNADTLYKSSYIVPGGSYRIRGTRGSLRIAKLGQFPWTTADNGKGVHASAYNDLNALKVDAEGRYDVILSPERPAGYTGDWWKLEPDITYLLIRQVSSDWSRERDPTISIERLDAPTARPRPDAADLQARLGQLAQRTANTAIFLVDHPKQLRDGGYVNKLKIFDVVTNLGGLFGQFYYEGAYQLADDEALLLEAKVPSKCGYYSTILTNDIYETTDWVNNQSSLNDAQSRVDKDGVLRIVISARDPGVPNWLSTAGYPSGVIQGRWTDCDAQPVPTLRKMKLAEIRGVLPADTPAVGPEQRERQLRDRRAAFLQRIFW